MSISGENIDDLLKALEFYADPTTYHDGMAKIYQDYGKQARVGLGRPETPDYSELDLRLGDTVAA